MDTVKPGRHSAQIEGPFVVFLIGMRVNRLAAVARWWPVSMAMPRMLERLYAHPETGFLGGENFFRFGPITSVLISYWRSFEDLERFARSPDEPHLSAWRAFNQAVGGDGSVGIWHETYMVSEGQYESVYANMPVFGLASAGASIPATGRRETARRRLGGHNEPSVPTPPAPIAQP